MKYSSDQVLDATIAVVAEQGVGVSTSRLARTAGISNGTLFNYFPTKQALLDAMYLRIKLGLGSAIGDLDDSAPIRQRARHVWERWIAWATERPDHWRVGRLLHGAELVSAEIAEQAMGALAPAMSIVDELALDADGALPPEYVGAVIQAHLDTVVELGLGPEAADAAFEVMWAAVGRAVAAPAPAP